MSLSALYGAQPLFVWVEDDATRVALTTAWAGDPVAIHVGGSHQTIRAVVEEAWRNGLTHVFGVVDRDFGRSNFALWGTPPKDLHTYVLQSHEIENLSLDPKSMAACMYNTGRRSEAEIELRLNEVVQQMTWWMACCAVLSQVRERRNDGFPSFPPSVSSAIDLTSALAYIMSSAWFATHAAGLPGFAERGWLANALQVEEARFSTVAAAGQWRVDFSGKQIFHRMSEFVYTTGSGKQKNAALLQAVVQQQVDTGTVPAELHLLRASMRTRVGLPP